MKATKEIKKCKWELLATSLGEYMQELEYYYKIEFLNNVESFKFGMLVLGSECMFCNRIKEITGDKFKDKISLELNKKYFTIQGVLRDIRDMSRGKDP